MNKKNGDRPTNIQIPGEANVTRTEKNSAQNVAEKNIKRRENAVREDEVALAQRETLATAREEASDLREDATDMREDAAGMREDAAGMREDAAGMREDSANLREDAANLREDASDLREEASGLREDIVQTREGEAHQRENSAARRENQIRAIGVLQTQSDDQMVKLQLAEEHLVTATLEAQKLTEQIQTVKKDMQHLAHYDALTDLPNRLLLQARLEQAISLARGQERRLAILLLDMDQFKHINDSLGHAVGDELLRSVANRLAGCVQYSDTIGRQGGDEFVLLLPSINRREDAVLPAQKILAALALPHHIDQLNLHITASIGISIFPDDGPDADTLIKSAETAMYHAKENERNNYKFFKKSMNIRAVERQSIEGGLRRALERQEFVLYYQPKINLHSGAIVGAEALIRWQHPQRGLLPPSQFISIAEDCSLILPIDRWVMCTACLQTQSWLQAGLPTFVIAVNVSAPEFRAPDFLDNLKEILADSSIAPDCLELELTESILMQDAESTVATLQSISALGVKLATDDFGTGYSSLSYLRKFPIDTLKIDQSFVNQMISNPDDVAIVSAVIGMAKSLRLGVIAEGVETPEQHAALLSMDCDEGQGYYFGRPVAAGVFEGLLKTGISLTGKH